MWFIWWDPCGLVCYLFGIFVVLLANYVTIFEILQPWIGFSLKNPAGIIHGAIFQGIIVLILWSYARAGFTDPGSVKCNTATPKDAYAPQDDPDAPYKPKRRFCPKCNCIKPPRAHHCSTCGRCVQKMDHHCPWVNNCVGSNNMKHFLLFLLWVFVGATYCFALCVSRFVFCWMDTRRCPNPSMSSIITIAAGAILSLFFAIFVVAMACDQYEGLVTNTTAIESMKAWQEEQRSVFEGLRDVMGEPFSWRWFVPLALLRDSPSFYEWKPSDDPDAYDKRDPIIRRHFKKLQEALDQGWQPGAPVRASQPRAGAPASAAGASEEALTPQAANDSCSLTAVPRHHAPAAASAPAGHASSEVRTSGDGLRQTVHGKKQRAAQQ